MIGNNKGVRFEYCLKLKTTTMKSIIKNLFKATFTLAIVLFVSYIVYTCSSDPETNIDRRIEIALLLSNN